MSDSIDNRIVSMEFENAEFERRAAQTSKTIDKLDEQLQFKDAGKGFDETVAMMNRADFSSISQSVASLASRFSFFGSIGRDILNDLTASLQGFTRGIAQTIDSLGVMAGLRSGFGQYESYISSTQTIAAALPDMTLDEIEGQLDQLVWFADETSYSFTDMVNSVGKFTAAGLGLDESITAMEGIANWAAISGVNARDASRAYYNLSQAIGMGKLTSMDWKSIENLGMATKEFKDAAIEAAVNMGTLKVRANGVFTTIGGRTKKIADSWEDLNSNFRNTLSEGWFDTKTMMNVFGRYGAFTAEVYKEYTKSWEDATTGKLTGEIIDELDKTGYELGAKAFAAAQSAKTFHDSIDAVKDAVASGWMQTFKLIFGNLDEAKDLWSDVVESLWRTFAGGAEGRNTFLKLWHEGIQMTIEDVPELTSEIMDANKVLTTFTANGKKLPVALSDGFAMQVSGYQHFANAFKTAFQIIADVAEQVRDSISGLFDQVSMIKSLIRGSVILDQFMTSLHDNLEPTLERIGKVITIVGTALKAVFGPIISTVFRVIGRVISEVARSIGSFVDRLELSEEGLTGFQKIGQGIAKAFDFIVLVFEKLAWALSPLLDIFGAIGELVLDVVSTFIDFGGALAENVEESEAFNAAFSGIRKLMQIVSQAVVAAIKSIQKIFDKLAPAIEPAWAALQGLFGVLSEFTAPLFEAIGNWFQGFEVDFSGLGDTLRTIAPQIGKALTWVWNTIQTVWNAVQPYLSKVWQWLLGFMGNFSFDILTTRIQKFIDYWNQHVWPVIKKIWEVLKDVFTAAWKGLSQEWSELSFTDKIDAAEGVAKILLIVQGIKTLKDSSKFLGAIQELFITLSAAITPVKDFPSKLLAVGAGLFLLTVALLALLSVPDESLQKMARTLLELGGGLLGLFTVINKLPGGGKKTAINTIATAIAVLILVNSLIKLIKEIKDQNVTERELIMAGSIIGGLVLLLGICTALMSVGNKSSRLKGSRKKSGATIATVLSVLAIMYAVKQLMPIVVDLAKANLNQNDLLTAAGIVGGMVLLLGIATMLGGLGGAKIGTAISFVALALTLKLLIPIINIVADLVKQASSDEKVRKDFETAMWIVGGSIALLGLMTTLSGYSKAGLGTAASFIALAVAVLAIGAVVGYLVDVMKKATTKQMWGAFGIIAVMTIIIGLMTALAGETGSWEGFASLLAMAVDVLAIAIAISIIGDVPEEKILKAGGVLALCSVAVGGMIWLASVKASWKGFASLLAAAAVVLAIGLAISLIGDLDDAKIWKAGLVLAICEVVVGGMILLANVKASWTGFAELIVAAATVYLIGEAIAKIGQLPQEKIIAAGAVMAACLIAVGFMITLANDEASWAGFAELIAAAATVYLIGDAIAKIGGLPQNKIIAAGSVLAVSEVAVGGMIALANIKASWAGLASLIAAAATVYLIGDAISKIGSLPMDKIIAAGIVLDATLAVCAILIAVAGAASAGGLAAVTLAAVAAVLLSIGAAAKMCAEAFVIFNQGLAMLAAILPPLGVSIVTFLQILVDGIDETLHTIWENFKAWAVQVAFDIPKLAGDIVAAFIGGLSEGIAAIGDALDNAFPGFDQWLADAWDTIKGWGLSIWNSIKEGFTEALAAVSEAWDSIKTNFSDWWNTAITAIKQWGSDIWNKIKEGFKAALDKVSDGWDSIKSNFTTWWNNTLATIKQWGSDIWNKIKEGFQSALNKVSDTWDNIKSNFSDWWNNTVEAVKAWGSGIWDKIKEGFSTAASKVSEVWDNIKTNFSSWWDTTIEAIKGWGSGIWDKIKEGFSDAVSNVSNVWNGIKTQFSDWWDQSNGSFLTFGKTILDFIISGIASKFTEIFNKAKEVGARILGGVRTALGISGGTSSEGENVGKNFLQGLIDGLQNVPLLGRIFSAAFGAGKKAKSGADAGTDSHSPSREAMETGENFLLGLIGGLSDKELLSEVYSSGETAGEEAVDSLSHALAGLYQFDDIDNEIHFTVVLDADEAMRQLQDMRVGTASVNTLSHMKLASAGLSMAKQAEASFQPVVRRDAPKTETPDEAKEPSVTYVQNNYSPKSLSRFDIYRQTRAQLLEFKKG